MDRTVFLVIAICCVLHAVCLPLSPSCPPAVDRIIFLHEGRVVWEGSVEEFDTTGEHAMPAAGVPLRGRGLQPMRMWLACGTAHSAQQLTMRACHTKLPLVPLPPLALQTSRLCGSLPAAASRAPFATSERSRSGCGTC